MKRDTIGTLRARIAELEAERVEWQQLHSTLFAEKNQWFAEAAKQATRADEATRRAEELEAALTYFVRQRAARVVVEGQESTNAKR